MLALQDVSYEIGGRPLVDRVTLAVAPGAITAVVGPNGAGKTTLLRQLCGIREPTRGAVTLGGRPLAGYSRRALARTIAYLPPETNLDFAFSVREVVAMGRHPHVGRFAAASRDDDAIVSQALERLEVDGLAERIFPSLSAGERQRVLLARCLATQARVLVLDEPTSNLDVGHALTLFELLAELTREGATIVAAVHDLNLASRYAQHSVVLAAGRVVAEGRTENALCAATLNDVFGVDVRSTCVGGARVLVFLPLARRGAFEPACATQS